MKLVLVSDDEMIGATVRQALLRHGQDCPAAHVVPFRNAGQQIGQTQPDLVVAVLGPDVDRTIEDLGTLTAGMKGIRVLVIGPTSDPKRVLRVLRNGAHDYVDESELDNELEAALARSAVGHGSEEPGRLIAVLAPSGGSGSSTLAANIATVLAKEHKFSALIDLKLESGDLAALLDLKPTYTLADLCQSSTRLDRVLFERTLVRHESGVHLLAPPRHLSDVSHVTDQGVRQALELARSSFPYVVVDLDHSFRGEQMQVLRQADIILLVLRLDFAALRNGRRTLEHLEHLGLSRERVRLVINRFGQPKEIPASKAEEALGLKIFHYVPDEPRTVNRANNNGVPLVLDAPSAKVSRSVAKLAISVNGRHKTGH